MVELLTNSGDSDQMSCSSASDLGLHCLPVTGLGISSLQWVNNKDPAVQSIVSLTSVLMTSLTVV